MLLPFNPLMLLAAHRGIEQRALTHFFACIQLRELRLANWEKNDRRTERRSRRTYKPMSIVIVYKLLDMKRVNE